MQSGYRSGGGGRSMRGVIVGIVSNINDPDQKGRVKVRLPWLDDQGGSPIETHWARVTGFYAGASRGAMFIPELGDEVMVAFSNGDPNHPYVIGGVWNGEHTVPGPGNPDGKNDHKWIRTRAGHDFEFLDSDGAEKIRLVDSSTNNSIVIDTAADTITTEAKTGTINIKAPKGHIQIDCVDLKMTTSEGRNLEVGTTHTVTVGQNRTVNVSAGNLVQTAGSSVSVTTSSFSSSTGSAVGVQAGAAVVNQGSLDTKVDGWSEVQQGPVTRTVGTQKVKADAFMTVNSEGTPSGPLTLLGGSLMTQADGGLLANGKVVTLMAGMLNTKSAGMVVAKDVKGGKAALSTWLGGLLLLNPNTLTFPATKLLDPIMGLDFHTTLPAPLVPPLPPIPLFPTPFMGPILIDFKPTVLINFRPAAGSGATAVSFHMPPLPWPWPPISHRPMITAAIMALMTAPFTAMLEMGRAKVQALAAGSNNETLKRGFVADLLGSSHVTPPPSEDQAAGDAMKVGSGNTGTFKFSRIFPMFASPQAFIGFLVGLIPLPVANASVNIASPTTTVCDAPLGMMIPLGANSCSDIPIVPNAAVVGFSNVLTGMSIGDFLGQLAWNAIKGAATKGFQGAVKKGANATARQISKSNNPRLQNAAQRINDFVGGDNCIAEGHPVDVVSGTLFSRQDDFTTHGAQSFTFERFYNSRAEHLPGDPADLGPGWRHNLDEWLIADDSDDGTRTLAYRNHEGRILGFDMPSDDGGQDFHPLDRLTLTRVDGRTYEIRSLDGTVRRFEFPGKQAGKKTPATYKPGVGNRAPLAALIEPMGGEGVRPKWQGSRLLGYTDPCGREVTATHDSRGRLTTLRLTRSTEGDCDIFLAAYEYIGDRLARHIDANRNPRRYAYDTRGRMVKETDRNGYAFHFRYDEDDRCVVTHGDDNAYWVEMEYVAGAPVTVARDALGGVTRYKHDPDLKLVTEIHDAEGGVTQTAYTDEGWPAEKTDPAGNTSAFEYDDRGRVIKATDANGESTVYTYTDGNLTQVTDPAGGETRYAHDAHGLVTEIVTPAGRARRVMRDELGRPVAVRAAELEAIRQWDATGLVRGETRPDGVRARYRYDALGRLTEVTQLATDGQRREVKYRRDAMGRITGIDGPASRRQRYELLPEGQPTTLTVGTRTARRRYEGWGRLAEHVDPIGRATRVSYDLHHMVTAVHLAGERSWRYDRDKLGRVTRLTTPDGVEVTYAYDPAGRLTHEHRADRTIARTYDGADRITAVDWGRGTESRFTYDALGRLTAAEGTDEAPLTRAYDADGFLVTEVQGDTALRHRYDELGRRTRRTLAAEAPHRDHFEHGPAGPIGLTDGIGGEHRFTYDAFGRRAAWHQAGGGLRTEAYDALDRLTADALHLPGGDVAVERRLTWSDDDTVTAIADSAPGGIDHAYDYDPAGRLTGWSKAGGAPRSYRLDDADNLLEEPGGPDKTYRADRLVADADGTAYRYDRDGRLVAIERPDGITRLWFDDRDRLVRVHTADDRMVHHRYDAIGRRVETLAEQPDGDVTTETFVWDGDRLARRMVQRGGAIAREETYTYDPSFERPLFRVVRSDGEAETQYYTTDQRGAVTRMTAADGRALWVGRADPYGRYREDGREAGEQPLRLAGQVADAATGLCHHRFRVYDPESARFVSPDPLGALGSPTRFGYPVDPIRYADPLGLFECGGGVTTRNLPTDPDDLVAAGFVDTTHPMMRQNTNNREFQHADTGVRLRFDEGKPGATGWEGQDHYHVYNPNSTGKGNLYLDVDGQPTPKGSKASHIPPMADP